MCEHNGRVEPEEEKHPAPKSFIPDPRLRPFRHAPHGSHVQAPPQGEAVVDPDAAAPPGPEHLGGLPGRFHHSSGVAPLMAEGECGQDMQHQCDGAQGPDDLGGWAVVVAGTRSQALAEAPEYQGDPSGHPHRIRGRQGQALQVDRRPSSVEAHAGFHLGGKKRATIDAQLEAKVALGLPEKLFLRQAKDAPKSNPALEDDLCRVVQRQAELLSQIPERCLAFLVPSRQPVRGVGFTGEIQPQLFRFLAHDR